MGQEECCPIRFASKALRVLTAMSAPIEWGGLFVSRKGDTRGVQFSVAVAQCSAGRSCRGHAVVRCVSLSEFK